VKGLWEREHPLLVSVLVRRFTYAVGGAEEEHTTWQRSGVRLAVMEKQLLLKDIRGELRIFIEKEYAKICFLFGRLIITLVNFNVD